MELRSSRDAGAEGAVGILDPFIAAALAGWGRLPGCIDCKPRGVSSITRKWPVNGGASAAGLCSGSIFYKLV